MQARVRLFLCVSVLLVSSCVKDRRDYDPPPPSRDLHVNVLRSESWDVCRLLGPKTMGEGIYGTDLGYTVALPGEDKLAVLFGDTWAGAGDACQYPVLKNDDLQASLPAARSDLLEEGAPSSNAQAQVCSSLEHTLDDASDPTSWRRMRLFASEADRATDTLIDTSALRTPVAAWSDGVQVYAMFSRGEPEVCASSVECPEGMLCSNDNEHGATPLGTCPQPFALSDDPMPQLCRNDDDCSAGSCAFEDNGVCVTDTAFEAEYEGQTIAPTWYRDDARLGAAHAMSIATAIWPDRPEDYLITHRFVTRRFVNVAARTIAHFDAEDPSQNDYAPGDHTLLMWGRPAFVTTRGVQSLPFLLYVPLDELRDPENPQWQPRFFAGYDAEGKARWSEIEADAQPIYGTEASVRREDDGTDVIEWREPEFDYVNQMSVSFIAPLQRFVMLYGGDVPAWLVMDTDGSVLRPVNLQPDPGAIHQRTARHPWGRATLNAPEGDAWSSPKPVLTREEAAPYLACGDRAEEALAGCTDESDENNPFDLLATIASLSVDEPSETADITGECIAGSAALAAQNEAAGSPVGRMYGVNIIDEWTADVTQDVDDLEDDERAVELYWNVSTWNPYQVVLMKTQLRAKL